LFVLIKDDLTAVGLFHLQAGCNAGEVLLHCFDGLFINAIANGIAFDGAFDEACVFKFAQVL
jgi:hypothetical protein